MSDFNEKFGITRNDTGEIVRKLPVFPTLQQEPAVTETLPSQGSDPFTTQPNPIKAQMSAATEAKKASLDATIESDALDEQVQIGEIQNEGRARMVDRYQVDMPEEVYQVIRDRIATAEDPDAEGYRWATAWRYTQMYDITMNEAYNNIEAYNKVLYGDQTFTPKDNFAAVTDALALGANSVRRGSLGTALIIATDNGNEYEINRIKGELAELNADDAKLADNQPRSWQVESLKFGAQSIPFTGYVALAGFAGGALAPAAATAAAFAASMQQSAGSEYLDLREDGVSHETARNLAALSGGLQAVVEIALGNTATLVGKAAGAQTITANLFKRMNVTKAWTRAARVVGEYVGETGEEGLEEALQSLISSGTNALAAELEGAGVSRTTAAEAAQDAWESWKGGILGSLVLGAAGVGINVHTEIKDALALKEASESIDSKEAFIKETADSTAFEGLSDEDRIETQGKIWESSSKKRTEAITAAAKELADTTDFTGEEAVSSGSGEDETAPPVRGAVQRTPEGKLYVQEGANIVRNDDGSTTRILKVGNPNEETSHNRYGYIKYREYENKVEIDEFRLSEGRDSIRREFYDAFAERVAGKEIEWDAKGERARAFRDEIIAANPAGRAAGLQYYRGDVDPGTVRGRIKLDAQVKKYLPRLNENERAAAVALLETRASVRGQDLDTYLGETFQSEMFSDATNVLPEAAQSVGLQGKRVKGGVAFPVEQVTGAVKALVYVTEKSDFSTYTHEIAHVFRRELEGDQLAEAEAAFGVVDGSWSREAEEKFAVGFEEYLREGKAPTTALQDLYRKIAEFMQKIYQALASRVEVSPDIRRVYDELLAGTGPIAELAKAGKQAETKNATQEKTVTTGEGYDESPEITSQEAEASHGETQPVELEKPLGEASREILAAAGEVYGAITEDMFFQAEAVKKLLEHMTREELLDLLHSSDSAAGIPNYRAYRRDVANDGAWPVQVSLDADSLKWVNDNMGHASGDIMLKEIGENMKISAEGKDIRIYHKSGDEFLAQAKTVQEYLTFKIELDNLLKNVIISIKDEELGATISKPGIFLSDGIDNKGDLNAADKNLEPEKHYRETHGERSGRGKVPPGVRVVYDTGRIVDDTEAQELFDRKAQKLKDKQESEKANPNNQFTPERTRELRKIIESGGDILFQYIGENAELADNERVNLSVAREMDTSGKDSETIRASTGWFKGKYDGKWRTETDPLNLKLSIPLKILDDFEGQPTNFKVTKLSDVIQSPVLEKYPELNEYTVQIGFGIDTNSRGNFSETGKVITLYLKNKYQEIGRIKDVLKKVDTGLIEKYAKEDFESGEYATFEEAIEGTKQFFEDERAHLNDIEKDQTPLFLSVNDEKQIKKTLTHEIQHAIQKIEGFARGSSPELFMDEYRKLGKQVTEINTQMNKALSEGDTDTYYKLMEERGELVPQIQKLQGLSGYVGLDAYFNTAGEIEARDVAERSVMSADKRRIKAPFSSEKIPIQDSIILFQTAPELDSKEFKKWFGESKVVDTKGRPLVVYHGSPDARDIVSEDGQFKSEHERFGMGRSIGVHWFTDSQATAKSYADDHRAMDYQNAEPGVIAAYLKIENPLVIEGGFKEWSEAQKRGKTSDVIEQAIEKGYDGLILKNVKDDYNNTPRTRAVTTYSVFSPEQIKSVKNRGTWDKNDPRILFQTEEDLIKDAATFDSWQDFMEYYEGWTRPADAAVPENVDAQWYQTVWEKAHDLIPEESLNAEEMAERANKDGETPGRPDVQDSMWLTEMQSKPEMLDNFLKRINEIMTRKEEFAPADADEQESFENIARLKRRITIELRHGSWISNATRMGAGRPLTERARRTLLTLIRQAARDYRSLYADIMEDEYWTVALADTEAGKLAAIADPKLDYAEMTPEQRRKIAERIDNEAIAQKLKTGALTWDEAERHITYLKKELRESSERERAIQKTLEAERDEQSEDYRRISDWQTRRLLELKEDLEMARAKHESHSDKTSRMIERGQAITKKYELESQQLKANYDTIFRKFSDLSRTMEISGAVQSALARRESLFEARAEGERIREQISLAREARKIRTGLVKHTMRRVSFERVDYDNARAIIAIQRKFFPALTKGLNKWIGTEGPYLREVYSGWKTSEDFRAELEEAIGKKRGGQKILKLLANKEFDSWTRAEREEALKILPKEDIFKELNLDELAKEREESLQLDETSDEFEQIIREALPARIAARIEKRPFAEWTIEEMEELAAVVDTLYNDGKRLLEGKKLARRNDAAQVRDMIEMILKDPGIDAGDSPEEKERKRARLEAELSFGHQAKGTLADSAERQSLRTRFLRSGYADANIRRVARILDNGKDGINTDLLYNQEDECFNKEKRRIRDRTRKINAAMTAAGVTLSDLYKQVMIDDFWAPGKGQSFTVDELLFVLKADDDDQSRQAVKYGNCVLDTEKDTYRGSDEIIENLAGPRYAAALAAAQALPENVRAFADAISEDYADQFERMNQASIEEYNQPVWRVQKYIPLLRLDTSGDTNENKVRDDLLNISGGRNQTGTEKGMTVKRIEISPLYQRPVQMGLYSTWNDAVKRTEHFIAYAPYVRELNRVYRSMDSSNLRGWIRSRHGDKMIKYLDDRINEVANPDIIGKQSQLDQIVRTLRGKTAAAYLGWKMSGVLKQFVTSPAPYFAHVSPAEYASAAFDLARHYHEISDGIREKSVFMDTRVMDPMIDLIREQQEKVTNPLAAGWAQFTKMGMQGLQIADWSCVAPGWLAVYRKSLASLQKENAGIEASETARLEKENETGLVEAMKTADEIKALAASKVKTDAEIEEQAIKAADDATRLCQPSSRMTDLAPMFKSRGENTEALKIILQFQTALNVIWQNIRYDLPVAVKNRQWSQVVGMIGGYVAAGVAVNLLTRGLGSDDDDEEAVARKFLFYSTTQFTDSVPLIGDMVTNLAQKAITGKAEPPFSDDMFPAASKVIQAGSAVASGDWDKAAWRIGEGIGYGLGAPVSGVKEALRGLGIADGDGDLEVNPEAFMGRR